MNRRKNDAISMLLEQAQSFDTPPGTLAALARSRSPRVRYWVGMNPNTPVEVLMHLSEDRRKSESWPAFPENGDRDRAFVSAPEVLDEWFEFESRNWDVQVRFGVAGNPETPPAMLMRFAGDENPILRGLVARHPRTPGDTLSALARDKSQLVRRSVLINPETPIDILAALAEDEHFQVRRFVALNRRTPRDILAVLAEDEVDLVYRTALNALVHISQMQSKD
jgi:hypothetical protein